MEFWDIESLGQSLGGTWIVHPAALPQADRVLCGVSTDSRAILRGQVFIALRGEKMDGHDYLRQAAHGGAGMLVIDSPAKLPDQVQVGGEASTPVLRVGNTGDALLRLAGAWRRALGRTPVVAVTGSNGKTTTTRLIEAVLSKLGKGTASIKSFNNRIGVPLTILRAKAGDKFLVCEVGTNSIGEIEELAAVIEPDVTVITSIGREHLEGLGGIEGSVREAVELITALRPRGVAIVPAGCPELDRAIEQTPQGKGERQGSILRFGETADSNIRVTEVRMDEGGVRFCLNELSWFHVPLIGRHNAMNSAAAVEVGRRLGLSDESIGTSLTQAKGAEMRLERRRLVLAEGGAAIDVINDAYNANPESMLAAIATFKEMYGKADRRRVAVLGDMLELGEHGPDCHREIGDAVAGGGMFDLCILVGPLMMFAADRICKSMPRDRVVPVPALDEAGGARVAAMLRPGDAVLLKGSRGMGIERVLRAIDGAGPAPTVPAPSGQAP